MRSFTRIAYCMQMTISLLVPSAWAENGAPNANSHWRDAKTGWCLSIADVSKPLSGSDECTNFTGSLRTTGPVSGYVCAEQKTIGIFAAISESDNSIKPDFFVGSYAAESIELQYCTRISNDWPPEFNCETEMKFVPVAACDP